MAPKPKAGAAAAASPVPPRKEASVTVIEDDFPPQVEAVEAYEAEYAYKVPQLPKETVENTLSFLRLAILLLICGAAVASRLFAVIRFESVIHEFDPWFN